MKTVLVTIVILVLFSCIDDKGKVSSEVSVPDSTTQSSIFEHLLTITHHQIPVTQHQDSLAFLIVPVQASCPSCLEKTIDSLLKYERKLPDNRYVIISANGGKKTMNYFFRKQDGELKDSPGRIFLDSIDQAGSLKMYENNPSIYFSATQKVYKKLLTKPATIKSDLNTFFSGR